MDRQVQHMVRLVDDLLEVARITSGKIELRKETVELSSVIMSAVETVNPVLESCGHKFSISLPPEPVLLEVDPVRLAQVVANLLHNATKYTEQGGEIWVGARREGDAAVIRVRDSGVGIPADMLPRVFDVFSQVDGTLSRAKGGLGIGLSLVKRLVELHGGTVEARSEGTGQGSEFIVRLPVPTRRQVPVEQTRDDGVQRASVASLRILVVDDNRDAADSMALMLRIMGNDTRAVYGGRDALDAAADFRPDVVLLDIGMPDMSGHEVARLIRQRPGGTDTTLVAVTGWGQEEDRRRSKESGFDAHLAKPAPPAALTELLATLPRARRAIAENPPPGISN
jgi:CheY-like chemotaxis protein/two-component sensor histidine kinase